MNFLTAAELRIFLDAAEFSLKRNSDVIVDHVNMRLYGKTLDQLIFHTVVHV
jgi:hypothetical protein